MADRDYPPQDYYPSAKARFIIRFEEFDDETFPPPEKRAPVRSGKGADPDPDATTPQERETSGDDNTKVVFGIIPKRAALSRNGLREADTLSMTFKYVDLPLDPRTIRSCAVELYLGTISADDFAAGQAGGTRVVSEAGSEVEVIEPVHMIPDEYTDANGQPRTNLRFQGWVDSWEVSWDGTAPLVSIECTDNTRQLIDQPAPPRLTIDPELPLDEAFAAYIAEFPQFEGIGVIYLPEDDEAPMLDGTLSLTATVDKGGPPPGGAGGGESSVSVWDYLTDVAGMLGHIVRLEGTDIVIQRSRSLLKGIAARADDPFQSRTLSSGEVLDRRLFLYGRNLDSMSMRRDFTRHTSTNVECRSYNPAEKRVVVGRHPQFPDRKTKANPGEATDQPWLVVRLQGIIDDETLRRRAQDVYEQINRSEIETTFSTRNLGSYGGGNDDPDVLDMLVGDAVDVELQRESADEEDRTVAAVEDLVAVAGRAVDFLTSIGFDEAFAATYAEKFIHTGLVSTFKVRRIQLDWDESSGIEVGIDAINYVVVRADAELPEGEEQAAEEGG